MADDRELSSYRAKYELFYRYGQAEHVWSAVTAQHGAHLSIRPISGGDQWCGGIEFHRGVPLPSDRAPDHSPCWLLGTPCWHDGSSLQVEEYWIPLWLSMPDNHGAILEQLVGWMNRQISHAVEVTE